MFLTDTETETRMANGRKVMSANEALNTRLTKMTVEIPVGLHRKMSAIKSERKISHKEQIIEAIERYVIPRYYDTLKDNDD